MSDFMEFKITLCAGENPPWRSFQLTQKSNFEDLHYAIQQAVGWQNCHMHQFCELKAARGDYSAGPVIARMDAPMDWEDTPAALETEVPLSDYFKRKGKKCIYNYDFGDEWWVEVEFIGKHAEPGKLKRKLIDGARAWPPDDLGGPYAYLDLTYGMLDVSEGKEVPPHIVELIAEKLEWMKEMGIKWDADAFNLKRAQKEFAS